MTKGTRAVGRARFGQLHLIAGVFAALPLLWITVTGLGLGLIRTLELAHPSGATVTANELLSAAQKARPGDTIKSVHLPKFQGALPWARFTTGEKLWLSSENLTPVAAPGFDFPHFVETLYHLHRGKSFGPWGQALASSMGVVGVGLFVSGLALRRLRASPARRGSARLRHQNAPMLLGAGVAAMFALGALANYSSDLTRAFAPRAEVSQAFSLEAYLAQNKLESVHFLRDGLGGHAALYYFADSSRVIVDAATGKPLEAIPWHAHWTRALFALHTGRALGLAQPIWVNALGIASLWLLATGMALFWKKQQKRSLLPAQATLPRDRPGSSPPRIRS